MNKNTPLKELAATDLRIEKIVLARQILIQVRLDDLRDDDD